MKSAVIMARSIAVRMTFIQNSAVSKAAAPGRSRAANRLYDGQRTMKIQCFEQEAMNDTPGTENAGKEAPRTLSPAAQRALAEAEERRAAALKREAAAPKEIGG